MSLVDVVVRVIAAGVSLVLFYVAWCVYENEEKVLQSNIETWWLQFDDLRSRMLTRQAVFWGVVSDRTGAVLDRIFRGPLLSIDSVATAGTLCVGSFSFVYVALAVHGIAASRGPYIPTMSAFAVTFAFCCVVPAFWPVLRWLPATAVVLAWIFMAIDTWTATGSTRVTDIDLVIVRIDQPSVGVGEPRRRAHVTRTNGAAPTTAIRTRPTKQCMETMVMDSATP